MIEKIKSEIKSNVGKTVKFKFNGARNQVEEFTGTIESTYNYIFIIRVNDENNTLRSFTYSDVLIENLIIYDD